MRSPWVRVMTFVAISTSLLVFLSPCTAQQTPRSGTAGVLRPEPSGFRDPPPPMLVKTSPDDCKEQGGHYRAPDDTLLGDCLLGIRLGIGPPAILMSAYDYFYQAGTESPGYGLYSYVLFPLYSPRAERFLEALFQTTGYNWPYDLREGLNVVYLPTRADQLPSLIPMIRQGSAPAVSPFAATVYDYALARRFLAQICTTPAEVIRDLCATDLSRGPYLFTYARPASGLSPVPPPYLLLDLSRVHPRAFGEVIRAYKAQMKRPDYTDRERIDTLRLEVLNLVLTAADWIAPTKGAITEILHMARGEGGSKN